MGRPRKLRLETPPKIPGPRTNKKPISLEILRNLATQQNTIEDAAYVFGVSVKTLKRRLQDPEFREAWEGGKAAGRMSLRRLQWRHANSGGSSAVSMTIHLSKHWLGESDRKMLEMSGPNGEPIKTETTVTVADYSKLTPEERRELLRLQRLATVKTVEKAAEDEADDED